MLGFSSILQGMEILKKCKDPGSVTIPYTIEDIAFKKPLVELGDRSYLMLLILEQPFLLT